MNSELNICPSVIPLLPRNILVDVDKPYKYEKDTAVLQKGDIEFG